MPIPTVTPVPDRVMEIIGEYQSIIEAEAEEVSNPCWLDDNFKATIEDRRGYYARLCDRP